MCFDYGMGCDLRCGGTIIDKNWIMSAAHCVDGYTDQPKYFGIKVGTFDYRDTNETGEIVYKVKEIHMNPKYGTPHQYAHDMSLLKIDGEITFTDHIQPVCIPKSVNNIVHTGKSAYVTGWGATSEGGPVSNKLRQVLVPFLDMSECKKEYKGEIDDTMECAGRQGVDSCQGKTLHKNNIILTHLFILGDSGGPLVTKHNDTGKWFQAGIVSWGMGCAEKGHAGVVSFLSQNYKQCSKREFISVCSTKFNVRFPPDNYRL